MKLRDGEEYMMNSLQREQGRVRTLQDDMMEWAPERQCETQGVVTDGCPP